MEDSPADPRDHFATNTVDLALLLSLVDPTLGALEEHDRWVGQHGYNSLSSAESLLDSVHSSASALWNHLEILWKQYEASEWVQEGIFGVLKSLGEATQRILAQIPRDPDWPPNGPLAIRLSERMTPVCFGNLSLDQFRAARKKLEEWIVVEFANSTEPDVVVTNEQRGETRGDQAAIVRPPDPLVVRDRKYPQDQLKLTTKGHKALIQAATADDSDKAADPAPSDETGQLNPAKEKLTWQEVAKRLEELQRQGEAFTSQEDFASRFFCSSSTVNKAIRKTPSLQPWAKRSAKSTPSATSLNAVHLDNLVDQREPNPADAVADRESADSTAGDDAAEIKLRKLMEDASPEDRAKLNAMTAENRSQLLQIVADDPGEAAKLLGRKP